MKYYILLIALSACTSTKNKNYSDKPDYGNPFLKNEIENILLERVGDSIVFIAYPKQDYVFEMGLKSLDTHVFDKRGKNIQFSICYADYPKPLVRNIQFFTKPTINNHLELKTFLRKLEDTLYLPKNYDFIIFFHWDVYPSERVKKKNFQIHKGLFDDIKELQNSGINIQIVNLYIGNRKEYNLNSEEFLNKKREYYQRLVDEGKI